jgi:hypothetical protein
MSSSCSRRDKQTLNNLIGRAMANADLEQALLTRATRQNVLENVRLADRTRRIVLEIEDVPSLDVLAGHIHTLLFNGYKQDG